MTRKPKRDHTMCMNEAAKKSAASVASQPERRSWRNMARTAKNVAGIASTPSNAAASRNVNTEGPSSRNHSAAQ